MANRFVPVGERPLAFVDLETTGLIAGVHEIIDLAIIVCDRHGDLQRGGARKVLPTRIDNAEPVALRVNGYSPERWATAEPLRQVMEWAKRELDGAVVAGCNVRFDVAFLHAALAELGMRGRFDYHLVELQSLAYLMLVPSGLERLSLAAMCEWVGIQPEGDVHTAFAGARKAWELFNVLRAMHFDGLRIAADVDAEACDG